MSRRLIPVLVAGLLLLVAALAAGCGGGGPRDPDAAEQAAIEARLDDYTQAFADGDPQAICDTFVPTSLDSLGGEAACIKAYKAVGEAGDENSGAVIANVDIDRIEIADDGSIARLYPVGATAPIRFQPVGEDWYVVPPAVLPSATAPADTSS